jgi:dTDP-4-dehydrorhamnose reductase
MTENGIGSGQALQNTRVLITGAGGQLGRYLRPRFERAGATVAGIGSRSVSGVDRVVDIARAAAVEDAISRFRPGIVIHAAAYTDVDGCERDPARAEAVNTDGSKHVAEAARNAGAYLIAVGTDFVFPGDGEAPYAEDALPRPISVYGQSKLAGEQAVLATHASFAVARTAWLYGGAGKHFPRTVLNVVRDRGSMDVVVDEIGCPTFAGDLADGIVGLAAKRGSGIFHLVNEGSTSRFAFAQAVAAAAELDSAAIGATTTAEFLARFPLPAKRPADSTLINRRAAALGISLRPWRDAVQAYVPSLAAELGVLNSGTPVPQEV